MTDKKLAEKLKKLDRKLCRNCPYFDDECGGNMVSVCNEKYEAGRKAERAEILRRFKEHGDKWWTYDEIEMLIK